VKFWSFVLAILLLPVAVARAHETRPAYLEIHELQIGQYRVVWKRPILGDVALPLDLRLPEICHDVQAPTRYATLGALTERRVITCDGGLAGKSVAIDGLEASITDTLVRVQTNDGRTQTHLLKPSSPSFIVPETRSIGGVALEYLFLGVDHILRGVDHLLFVLGLLLIVAAGSRVEGRGVGGQVSGDGFRPSSIATRHLTLFKTITSFTVAHSITLGVATLGYASLPVPPLNAVIALSILFLGPEMVRAWRGQTSLTIRRPWLVAFAFGLLHGFGFASGLTDLGLPRAEIPLALLLFNLGVELGQIGFVLLVFALAKSFRLLEITWPGWAELLPGYAVGSLGAFWTMERVTMMFGGIK
jgi:hydrogenase/urease accessory protein HupE